MSVRYIVTRVEDIGMYDFTNVTPIKDIIDLIGLDFYMSSGVVIYEKDNKGKHIKRVPFKYEDVTVGNNVFTFIDTGLSYSILKSDRVHNVRFVGDASIIEEMLTVPYISDELDTELYNMLPKVDTSVSLKGYLWCVIDTMGIEFSFKSISLCSYCDIPDKGRYTVYEMMYLVKKRYFDARI